MEKQEFIVTVDDDHLDQIREIADRCRSLGMEVQQVLNQAGVISGRVDPRKVAKVQQVRGVSSVEPAGSIQIPPPDSEIQ